MVNDYFKEARISQIADYIAGDIIGLNGQYNYSVFTWSKKQKDDYRYYFTVIQTNIKEGFYSGLLELIEHYHKIYINNGYHLPYSHNAFNVSTYLPLIKYKKVS